MFMNTSSIRFRCVASLLLVLWGVSANHNVLLDLTGIDHHHDQHVAVDHSHHHHHDGHSHSSESEHNHRDSIPLPDTHTDPITSSIAKIVVDGPKQVSDNTLGMLSTAGILLSGTFEAELENTPRIFDSDPDPSLATLLAHSVQSNAPPVIS